MGWYRGKRWSWLGFKRRGIFSSVFKLVKAVEISKVVVIIVVKTVIVCITKVVVIVKALIIIAEALIIVKAVALMIITKWAVIAIFPPKSSSSSLSFLQLLLSSHCDLRNPVLQSQY